MEVINKELIEMENETEEVGGDLACFLGCAGSCILFGGVVSALGAVTTFA